MVFWNSVTLPERSEESIIRWRLQYSMKNIWECLRSIKKSLLPVRPVIPRVKKWRESWIVDRIVDSPASISVADIVALSTFVWRIDSNKSAWCNESNRRVLKWITHFPKLKNLIGFFATKWKKTFVYLVKFLIEGSRLIRSKKIISFTFYNGGLPVEVSENTIEIRKLNLVSVLIRSGVIVFKIFEIVWTNGRNNSFSVVSNRY